MSEQIIVSITIDKAKGTVKINSQDNWSLQLLLHYLAQKKLTFRVDADGEDLIFIVPEPEAGSKSFYKELVKYFESNVALINK